MKYMKNSPKKIYFFMKNISKSSKNYEDAKNVGAGMSKI